MRRSSVSRLPSIDDSHFASHMPDEDEDDDESHEENAPDDIEKKDGKQEAQKELMGLMSRSALSAAEAGRIQTLLGVVDMEKINRDQDVSELRDLLSRDNLSGEQTQRVKTLVQQVSADPELMSEVDECIRLQANRQRVLALSEEWGVDFSNAAKGRELLKEGILVNNIKPRKPSPDVSGVVKKKKTWSFDALRASGGGGGSRSRTASNSTHANDLGAVELQSTSPAITTDDRALTLSSALASLVQKRMEFLLFSDFFACGDAATLERARRKRKKREEAGEHSPPRDAVRSFYSRVKEMMHLREETKVRSKFSLADMMVIGGGFVHSAGESIALADMPFVSPQPSMNGADDKEKNGAETTKLSAAEVAANNGELQRFLEVRELQERMGIRSVWCWEETPQRYLSHPPGSRFSEHMATATAESVVEERGGTWVKYADFVGAQLEFFYMKAREEDRLAMGSSIVEKRGIDGGAESSDEEHEDDGFERRKTEEASEGVEHLSTMPISSNRSLSSTSSLMSKKANERQLLSSGSMDGLEKAKELQRQGQISKEDVAAIEAAHDRLVKLLEQEEEEDSKAEADKVALQSAGAQEVSTALAGGKSIRLLKQRAKESFEIVSQKLSATGNINSGSSRERDTLVEIDVNGRCSNNKSNVFDHLKSGSRYIVNLNKMEQMNKMTRYTRRIARFVVDDKKEFDERQRRRTWCTLANFGVDLAQLKVLSSASLPLTGALSGPVPEISSASPPRVQTRRSRPLVDDSSFVVATPSKSLLLTASSISARDEWLQAFADAFKKLRAQTDRLQHGNSLPQFYNLHEAYRPPRFEEKKNGVARAVYRLVSQRENESAEGNSSGPSSLSQRTSALSDA